MLRIVGERGSRDGSGESWEEALALIQVINDGILDQLGGCEDIKKCLGLEYSLNIEMIEFADGPELRLVEQYQGYLS